MMFWQELILSRAVSDLDLARAIAAIFGIPLDAVRATNNVLVFDSDRGDELKVLLERRPARGEFSLRVRVYLRDTKLEKLVGRGKRSLSMVQRFCELVETDCLVSDDSLNSLSWLLIKRDAAPIPVTLDTDRLDHDEFVVVAERAARVS